MSNIYILEPPTFGKVLFKTTVGDIDVELWAKETPKTCRNFIQLCLENYYDGTIFHRLVKGFIVQGGDPNGDGTGGESIYGEPFKDEFHSRLRFTRRGILAMANSAKDDNASQFFFTLAATPELQNKHTIFGKVAGETIYNMLKLEEGMIEDERPVYPHKILKTEVLSNPFPDIVPKIKEKKDDTSSIKKKERKSGVKNFKLLSFGAEAEEDEAETNEANEIFSGKGKSTHDVLKDPKLSSKTEHAESDKNNSSESDEDIEQQLENIRNKLKVDSIKKLPITKYYLDQDKKEERKRKHEEIKKEIESVKREYKKNKLAKEEVKVEEVKKQKFSESETFTKYKEEQDKYKNLKESIPKKGRSREDFTLQLLSKFKQKLNTAKEKLEETAAQVDNKEEGEQSSDNKEEGERSSDNKEEGERTSDTEESSWLAHELHFQEDAPILAKDASTKNDDWYEVFDPRNPLNKRRRGEGSKPKKT